MKKYILILIVCLEIILIPQINAQPTTFKAPWGDEITVDFGDRKSDGGNNSNSNEPYISERSKIKIPPVSQTEFNVHAADLYKKGIAAWNKKDWAKASHFAHVAHLYNTSEPAYIQMEKDADAFDVWDKGAEMANKEKKYDEAVVLFKKALMRFPAEEVLKRNIIFCQKNKITGEAYEFYKNAKAKDHMDDWINAAAYLNVLMKNFDEKSDEIINMYSVAYTKVVNAPKGELILTRFNSKVESIASKLEYRNANW